MDWDKFSGRLGSVLMVSAFVQLAIFGVVAIWGGDLRWLWASLVVFLVMFVIAAFLLGRAVKADLK